MYMFLKRFYKHDKMKDDYEKLTIEFQNQTLNKFNDLKKKLHHMKK